MIKDELKIGIALSGGGVRAAVFHLGILGRLAEDGFLEKITRISTVSGGTLITGLVYSIAGNKWPTSDFFLNECLVQTRYYLTKKDIQLNAIFWGILRPIALIQKRANLISQSIQNCWKISGTLNDVPRQPRWILNATTYESGKNWRFIPQRRMGDYVVNYVENPNILLADAMAASAAYPELIGALVLDTRKFSWFKFEGKTLEQTQPKFKKLHLWDGGLYDNLGVEVLFKVGDEHPYPDDCNFLVVSDASNPIGLQKHTIRFWRRALRLIAVSMDQVRSLRARILINHFENHRNSGVYFKIGNTGRDILEDVETDRELIDRLTKNSLSPQEVQSAGEFKTTLRKLTEAEYDFLYRHGWEVANFTLQTRCPDLFQYKEWSV